MDGNAKTPNINAMRYSSFPEIFSAMRNMAEEYGNMPMDALIGAFGRTFGVGYNFAGQDPYTQNRRVKAISTTPANYNKNQIADMLQNPETSEQPLRAVENALEYTAYPLFHTRTVYQNLLTYHSYIAPSLTDKDDAKRDDFWREWKLLEKLRKKLNPKDTCHMIAGQALKEGKVFYYPRIRVDKPHNKVDHAFLQQMPSDYIKIVGFNNVSKYTVAFNMMYFMMPGTTPAQFGNLFEPYLADFYDSVSAKTPKGIGKNVVYASIDLKKVAERNDPDVEAYYQSGSWCYWVTLPIDKVFPFEIDDTNRNVVPVLTGLFIDFVQLAQMEAIQLELLQNPLVSILTGSIPYWNDRATGGDDQYKLSNAGMLLFQSLWYQMLAQNNTSGIGLFMAPLENMRLESIAEAPSAMQIVSQGFTDVMSQAGLTALVPTTSDARAGAVQVSLMIESKMPQTVYRCFERLFNSVIEKLNMTYDWEFRMFGDLASDKDTEKSLKEDMTLGLLPAAIEWNAMHDRAILDDIAWSDAIDNSGLLERRKPLVTSFSAKQADAGLPPQGGRPRSDENLPTSEGQEADADDGK